MGSGGDRDDAHGAGVGAADRDGHPPDPDGQRILAERPKVERLDRDAFVEPEMAQAAGFGFTERGPVDGRNFGTRANLQLVEASQWRHLRVIIIN